MAPSCRPQTNNVNMRNQFGIKENKSSKSSGLVECTRNLLNSNLNNLNNAPKKENYKAQLIKESKYEENKINEEKDEYDDDVSVFHIIYLYYLE